MSTTSIGSPSGRQSSTCGYCSPSGERSKKRSSYHVAGLEAETLSCGVYQKMIDRGWRRSGTWCYKPDLRRSCCPQYTIKLDALTFKPSRSQRKLVNRWNRFVTSGKEGEAMDVGHMPQKLPKHKGESTFSLSNAIHTCEIGFYDQETKCLHDFETILEPSSFTEEKYALFEKYQKAVHNDRGSSPAGFERFIVDTPLQENPIAYPSPPPHHLPTNYGSYHQLYRLDGQLIAIAVLDILPECVSSVYFIYDPIWENFSLGKLSALREVSLAREIHEAGVPHMGWLYMGFYIHSCPKMRYKGDYAPSYLADPETYNWFPLSTCLPLLDKYRYACFSEPRHSLSGLPDDVNEIPPPLDAHDMLEVRMVTEITPEGGVLTVPINETLVWNFEGVRNEVLACVYGLGVDITKEIGFSLWS